MPRIVTQRTPLRAVLKTLRARYGAPAEPISRDPFQLILWEQVGYLVTEAQRLTAFTALRTQVGLKPAAILGASPARLTVIARLGGSIAAAARAGRMRRSAELVVERWSGDLKAVLKQPLPQARRALTTFPTIGEPGADKILAFAGTARLIPLDSNGLRVLQRLGFAPVARDYRRSYHAAQEAIASQVPPTQPSRVGAYYLLRQHGQELCRRGVPLCSQCPLLPICPTGRG